MDTIAPIEDGIAGISVPCGDGVDVRALLLFGSDYTLLIDTLSRPADLDEAREGVLSRGKPLIIANSHADWDHWWGNAAFPDAPVIAHHLTRERQHREGKRTLTRMQRDNPEAFGGVVLRPATIGFEGRLDIDLGDLTVELHALPGHTRDCIVAFMPQRRLLFAGDVAEVPIPLLNEGPVGNWPDNLDHWAERTRTVVPAHGEIGGPELLQRNAAYLRSLTEDPQRAIPELEAAPSFYRRAHRRNLKRAAAS